MQLSRHGGASLWSLLVSSLRLDPWHVWYYCYTASSDCIYLAPIEVRSTSHCSMFPEPNQNTTNVTATAYQAHVTHNVPIIAKLVQ